MNICESLELPYALVGNVLLSGVMNNPDENFVYNDICERLDGWVIHRFFRKYKTCIPPLRMLKTCRIYLEAYLKEICNDDWRHSIKGETYDFIDLLKSWPDFFIEPTKDWLTEEIAKFTRDINRLTILEE